MKAFEQLGKIVNARELRDAQGGDEYMKNLDRLAIPITFIHGEENQCYLPEGTRKTVEKLTEVNGPNLYKRHLIPGYGHIDCIFGKSAATTIFPLIVEALDEHEKVTL
jgi:cholesterol oxidase